MGDLWVVFWAAFGFGYSGWFLDLGILSGLPTQPDVPKPWLGPQTKQAEEESSLNQTFEPLVVQSNLSKKLVGFELIPRWSVGCQLTE